jgi:hypothetical protein
VGNGDETARAGATLMIPLWIEIAELATAGMFLAAAALGFKKNLNPLCLLIFSQLLCERNHWLNANRETKVSGKFRTECR